MLLVFKLCFILTDAIPKFTRSCKVFKKFSSSVLFVSFLLLEPAGRLTTLVLKSLRFQRIFLYLFLTFHDKLFNNTQFSKRITSLTSYFAVTIKNCSNLSCIFPSGTFPITFFLSYSANVLLESSNKSLCNSFLLRFLKRFSQT